MKDIGICFYFSSNDDDEYSGTSSFLNFWRLCGKAYGVKKYAIIADEKMDWNDSSVTLYHYYNFEEFTKEHLNYVRLSGKGNSSLDDYKETEWFCFGPPEGWPEKKEDIKLDFPDDRNLHAVQVLPVFLDRFNKIWQSR